MLVITRRAGERIRIGDDVVVQVMEVTGSGVRLGIEAPRSTRIYREELWLAVQEENRAAAQAAPADLPKAPEPTGHTTEG
jgi:carbon storage regulator